MNSAPPLRVLRGEAEGVLTKPRTGDQYREGNRVEPRELQRLSAMIDNLLSWPGGNHWLGQLSFFDGRAAIEKDS